MVRKLRLMEWKPAIPSARQLRRKDQKKEKSNNKEAKTRKRRSQGCFCRSLTFIFIILWLLLFTLIVGFPITKAKNNDDEHHNSKKQLFLPSRIKMVRLARRFFNKDGTITDENDITSLNDIPVDTIFPNHRLVETEYHPFTNNYVEEFCTGTMKCHAYSTKEKKVVVDHSAQFKSWECKPCRKTHHRITHREDMENGFERCYPDRNKGDTPLPKDTVSTEGTEPLTTLTRTFYRPCMNCKANHAFDIDLIAFDDHGKETGRQCRDDSLEVQSVAAESGESSKKNDDEDEDMKDERRSDEDAKDKEDKMEDSPEGSPKSSAAKKQRVQ